MGNACSGSIGLWLAGCGRCVGRVRAADKKPITRRNRKTGEAKTVDPEDAHLNELIAFYLRNGDPAFESFLERVKTRGNAIHHFRERNIGTQDELKADIVRLRDFLVSIDRQHPDPPPLPDPDPDW